MCWLFWSVCSCVLSSLVCIFVVMLFLLFWFWLRLLICDVMLLMLMCSGFVFG